MVTEQRAAACDGGVVSPPKLVVCCLLLALHLVGCKEAAPQMYTCGCNVEDRGSNKGLDLRVCSDSRLHAIAAARICAPTYTHGVADKCNCKPVLRGTCTQLNECLGTD